MIRSRRQARSGQSKARAYSYRSAQSRQNRVSRGQGPTMGQSGPKPNRAASQAQSYGSARESNVRQGQGQAGTGSVRTGSSQNRVRVGLRHPASTSCCWDRSKSSFESLLWLSVFSVRQLRAFSTIKVFFSASPESPGPPLTLELFCDHQSIQLRPALLSCGLL